MYTIYDTVMTQMCCTVLRSRTACSVSSSLRPPAPAGLWSTCPPPRQRRPGPPPSERAAPPLWTIVENIIIVIAVITAVVDEGAGEVTIGLCIQTEDWFKYYGSGN